MKTEIEKAIESLKSSKAPDVDNITGEIIKAMGGELGTEIIHKLCSIIWESGRWPLKWCESLFIPLFKKGCPTDCANYRTIALINHTSKVLLHIINSRLKYFILK